jgi:hypothetical protein
MLHRTIRKFTPLQRHLSSTIKSFFSTQVKSAGTQPPDSTLQYNAEERLKYIQEVI